MKTTNTTPTKVNHNTYGGLISQSDFETDYPPFDNTKKGSRYAKKILYDWKFDKHCKKNAESRDGKKEVENG